VAIVEVVDGSLHVSISHGLVMGARFNPMAWLIRTGPRIAIDGKVVSRAYKAASFQLPPGRHRLEIWIRWIIVPRLHHASCTFDLAAGESIVARYSAPRTRDGHAVIELGHGDVPLPEARIVDR
jgi:hypothetical protein